MARLTIWYSVRNGGDGSAYPRWFENERLTEMDQDLMEEGWGECCNGSITFEGDNLSVVDRVTTVKEFIKHLEEIVNYPERRYGPSNEKRRTAQRFLDELRGNDIRPQRDIIRNYNENDPYGEEIDEKIIKYKNFKKI